MLYEVITPAVAVGLIFLLIAGLAIYSLVQSRIGKTAANNAKNGVKSNRTFGYLFFHISYNYENGKDIRLYNAQNMLGEKIKDYVGESRITSYNVCYTKLLR